MSIVKASNKEIGIIARVENGIVVEISVGNGGFADEFSGDGESVYRQFRDYLDRKNFRFTLDLDTSKYTPFQKEVFGELVKVPAGQTISYLALAKRVKGPKHARAVARAVAKNPFPVVIPCHRVVGLNGLGGYSGGFEPVKDPIQGLVYKVRLLRHEGVESPLFEPYR